MSKRTGKRADGKCSECGYRFSAQLMTWDCDQVTKNWTHRCDDKQETAREFLLRTEPSDSEYRKQVARRNNR